MDQITKDQSQIISQTLKRFPNGTEFAVALVDNGHKNYHGVRQTDGSIELVNNENSYFEIGSITKVFTAVIMVNMLKKHGIKLEDAINPYLDIQIHNNQSISFLSLANHTSGLPDYAGELDFDGDSEDPFVNFKKQDFLNYAQNELVVDVERKGKWSYSNIGVAILGYVLCLIEKRRFRELLDEHVFSKYNMPTSTCDRNSIKGLYVGGQNSKGKPIPSWGIAEMDEPTGAVLSNVNELSNFVLANFNEEDKTLKLVRKKSFNGNEHFDFALSLAILKENNYHFMSGGMRGHVSKVFLDEEKKKGVVILSNVSCYHKELFLIRDLGIELMDSI